MKKCPNCGEYVGDNVVTCFKCKYVFQSAKEKQEKEKELKKQKEEYDSKLKNFIVTTTDLHQDYEVIGPVYIQINNRSNQFGELRAKYAALTEQLQQTGQRSNDRTSGLEVFEMLFLNAGAYNGHADFDVAFFIAVEELKERALLIGADAIVGMRQDIDIDSVGFQYFYLQMYGTAVKYK